MTDPRPQLDEGFVLADKPGGLGSAALVGRLKYELKQRAGRAPGQRQIRVGHTGTLDRFARGLMLLLTGRATALADQFLHADKGYLARFQFGAFTDTHDCQGEITESVPFADVRRFLTTEHDRIARAILAIREHNRQQPPQYSALKQAGQRFSDRARAGETVLPAERAIQVYDVRIVDSDAEAGAIDVDLHVSGGTYIRAFARDLSRELDFPIHLSALRRYRLGQHVIDLHPNPTTVRADLWCPEFTEEPGARPVGGTGTAAPVVRDVREALPDWPRLAVSGAAVADVLSGRFPDPGPLPGPAGADFFIESGETGALLAWARVSGPGIYKYMRVFG